MNTKLPWSDNVKYPPTLFSPEEFDPCDFAYPFENSGPDTAWEDPSSEPVLVDHESVTFFGQKGPVKEVGVNGCQIDDILVFVLGTLRVFNAKFPCEENVKAMRSLEECLFFLKSRKRDREERGVEGYSKA